MRLLPSWLSLKMRERSASRTNYGHNKSKTLLNSTVRDGVQSSKYGKHLEFSSNSLNGTYHPFWKQNTKIALTLLNLLLNSCKIDSIFTEIFMSLSNISLMSTLFFKDFIRSKGKHLNFLLVVMGESLLRMKWE